MKKQKGSKNRDNARVKVARLEEHITNQRKDFQKKLALQIVKQYQVIGIEDLDLKGIAKFLRNAKNINDTGWNSFAIKTRIKIKKASIQEALIFSFNLFRLNYLAFLLASILAFLFLAASISASVILSIITLFPFIISSDILSISLFLYIIFLLMSNNTLHVLQALFCLNK